MYGISQATRDARRHVLSRREETRLHAAYLAGDHVAGQRLVSSFLPMLARSAHARDMPRGHFGDMLGVAVQAFMENLYRFDPARGHRMWTYMQFAVRHAVSAYACANRTFFRLNGVNDRTAITYLEAEKSKLGACGRPLTGSEAQHLADVFGVSESIVHGIDDDMLVMRPESLRGDRMGEYHGIDDPERADGHLDFEMRHDHARHMELLKAGLDLLDARQRDIVLRRFRETPDTLKQLSEEMGVSRERIRQIEENALRRLRHAMDHPGELPPRRRACRNRMSPDAPLHATSTRRSGVHRPERRQKAKRTTQKTRRKDAVAAALMRALP